ncbi:hypothetical protein B0O99DRAFT_689384 [Bisporella sp. PMI_857]|nr:hypothetical protein B0O99DRAFT_689384 [Bisporella sp. PMI_857]
MFSRSRPSHRSSSRYGSSEPVASSFQQAQFGSAWPQTSFLFVVNELPINEDSGVTPRYDENGRWLPPLLSNAFAPQIPGRVYRWTDGAITRADGYEWFQGEGWTPQRLRLDSYRTTAMFYCNPWTQHLMAECDPSREDMITADHPNNRWWPFTFRHRGALSDVTYGTEEQYLAGSSARWINHLGLNDYVHQESETPLADGLAGNLATVIALIAFSCRRSDWHDILMHDRAWWNYRWRGHNRRHGRTEQRGLVATVYYDPENTQGSTRDNLYAIEWNERPLLA